MPTQACLFSPPATLRPYQARAIELLYRWFRIHPTGNPCIVMPTGSGKSHVIGALCKDSIQAWPDTRVLILSHVKELLVQDADKIKAHWPEAPVGIYSAGLGQRVMGQPITVAGIQSVRSRHAEIGNISLAIVDECHLIRHDEDGSYRTLLGKLQEINPALRVVGLTATPYRLGHGLITDKPAIFDDLIEPATIEELIWGGHLAPLRSKITVGKVRADGVSTRGGEYVEHELQAAVNKPDLTALVVDEIVTRAGPRRAWLLFCCGVEHSQAVAAELVRRGVVAACVTGETPRAERDAMLADFRAGKIRAVTNANVLTTGFDYPDLDLLAMLRPTLSAGLYVQMAGRGMRIKSHTDHCMVLDFAGNVARHGPITAVEPPGKAGKSGKAPTKTCPDCGEIVAAGVRKCPACDHAFPAPERDRDMSLRDDDIMGKDAAVRTMPVAMWRWARHVGKTSGKEMLRCDLYGEGLSDPIVKEYFVVLNEGWGGDKARRAVLEIASQAGVLSELSTDLDLDAGARVLEGGRPPSEIAYKRDGKFWRVVSRKWTEPQDKPE